MTMVINVIPFHSNMQQSDHQGSVRSTAIITQKLNLRNLSYIKLPLFEMTEFTNRDVFPVKGMIGGNANNGKGDTHF